MAVLNNSALVGASGKSGGALPQRSLRFSSADSSYLSKTFSSAGNRRTWTFSAWVKRSKLGATQALFFCRGTAGDNTTDTGAGFTDTDELRFVTGTSNAFISSAVFRDVSAWYHVVYAFDTTQAVSSSRVKVYVNGTQLTAASANYPDSNSEWFINSLSAHGLGRHGAATHYLDGYLANIHFIDGQALTPSAFAYTDSVTGRWEPKPYEGSYSGNSFYLDFSDSSAATAVALGKDRSGLSNNWVPNNLAVPPSVIYKDPNFSVGAMTAGGTDYPPSVMFSGNLALGWGAGMSPRTNKYVLTNAVSIPAGNLEVYSSGGPGDYGGWWYVTIINSAGASFVSPNINTNTPAWYSLGSSIGNIKEIWHTFYGNGPDWAYAGGAIYGFRVGSQLFVSTENYTFNDSLLDHPVSAGADGGLGGQVSGNYCTLNPLDQGSSISLANGNLDVSCSSSWKSVRGTIGVSSGKWYWEYTMAAAGYTEIGIGTSAVPLSTYPGSSANAYVYYSTSGNKANNGSYTSYGNSYTNGDVIGVAVDFDNGKIWFSKNGTWQNSGNPASGINPAFASFPAATYFPIISLDNTGGTVRGVFNAGARNFAANAPSGFKALCDQNLPSPLIARPSTVMDVVAYTGSGGAKTITGLGFSPDLVWSKYRGSTGGNISHLLYDTVRGVGPLKGLNSDQTRGEGSCYDQSSGTGYGYLSAFNSDGYTVVDGNQSAGYVNYNGHPYVSWLWDAGTSSAVSNNDGTIACQVKANIQAGFSIISWSSNGTKTGTLGHGLGVKPRLAIAKTRNASDYWVVYTDVIDGSYDGLFLNSTDPKYDSGGTNFTNLVFNPYDTANTSGLTGIAYCFAPVPGLSAFGAYAGGGSLPRFIHTGFRPKLIWVKNYNSNSYPAYTGWYMWDSVRGSYNYNQANLNANSSNQEGIRNTGGSITDIGIDILSNGFCLRAQDDADTNWSSGQYIYCAWAESPFKYARAR